MDDLNEDQEDAVDTLSRGFKTMHQFDSEVNLSEDVTDSSGADDDLPSILSARSAPAPGRRAKSTPIQKRKGKKKKKSTPIKGRSDDESEVNPSLDRSRTWRPRVQKNSQRGSLRYNESLPMKENDRMAAFLGALGDFNEEQEDTVDVLSGAFKKVQNADVDTTVKRKKKSKAMNLRNASLKGHDLAEDQLMSSSSKRGSTWRASHSELDSKKSSLRYDQSLPFDNQRLTHMLGVIEDIEEFNETAEMEKGSKLNKDELLALQQDAMIDALDGTFQNLKKMNDDTDDHYSDSHHTDEDFHEIAVEVCG